MSAIIEQREALALLTWRAVISAVAASVLVTAASLLVAQILSLSIWYMPKVAGLFVLALGVISRYLPAHLPRERLGPANQVTLARLALTALVGGCLGETGDSVAWFAVGTAAVVLALDGVDGWLARRGGWTSAFGALFDMETDALLILLMAALAWQLEKAGAWVLLAGLMRYLFVAAATIWSWLSVPLPPSHRRQAVCVMQVLSLLFILAPAVGHPWSTMLAVGGLFLLCYSFAVDVNWLRRHSRHNAKRQSMKKLENKRAFNPITALLLAIILFLGIVSTTSVALAEPVRYKIDPDHLSIGFLVDHIGYQKTLGMFRKAGGSYLFDESSGALSDIEVVIETESVFSNHRKRDEHLRSADFLNSKEFPRMVFRAKGAERTGERTYSIKGNLELLGKSKPVTLLATWNKSAEYPFGGGLLGEKPYVMGVSARGSFQRSAYGMNYAVDNGWVGDEIELIIEFEAIRQ
jgi:polyisoprenoid-binding protein YceI/phosphatidylglycerophosphate synthase